MMDLLARGFEDKLRERRAKIISRDSDALLVVSENKIVDTYRTRTTVGIWRRYASTQSGVIYQQTVKRHKRHAEKQ